ncbi:Aspartyl/glutamyl-tRNA(Asn/Gln) amidotransferase subunit C [Labeo rohita]|uniref:Aspartyl/glutamyl-tRNA(Asn/Gln) amidotransferase subunit C n=1 Tax=Labeo rohita TaxID=84645 RepID=A0ABQ8M181_LABRO|nr:Aspartyl/glutamyl-tRNA(Asn/Gln) amidotransferase subunit C [Labeo rohita]
MYHPQPYTAALQALQDKYGQPRQLVQSELGAILSTPPLKLGDANAFDSFALSVQSLVGMLRTLEGQNGYELLCGSHVDRLLSKLPPAYRDSFVEYCLSREILQTGTDKMYTLPDFAEWLQIKSQVKRISSRAAAMFQSETPKAFGRARGAPHPREHSRPVLLTRESVAKTPDPTPPKSSFKPKPYCPHCDNRDHYLNSCETFKKLTNAQIVAWIKDGKRCWRCGRFHAVESCNLKRPCKICKELHLTVLHDSISDTTRAVLTVSLPSTQIYLDRPNRTPRVMLKVVKVLLHNGPRTMEAHAVLDDGSERTLVLSPVVQQLKLTCTPELLHLQTVRQCHTELEGSSVSFEVSSVTKPTKRFTVPSAFTATGLSLAEHNYPVAALQRAYRHLRDLPLPPVDRVKPLLLIGSDMPHLLMPIQPVCRGPEGGPIAIRTQLGWSLQGPMSPKQPSRCYQQCLHITTAQPHDELIRHVERLWLVDTLPYNERMVTRSKQDKDTLAMLQNAITRVDVDGVQRYATPLLQRMPMTILHAGKEAVLPSLRSTERRLARDHERAKAYCTEIHKLESAGYVAKITTEEAHNTSESWFIPHHMVHHNGKDRIVFNCSFQHQGQSLNSQLLAGPMLGPSLLGVLLRFRQHTVAVSGDIKGMFHQGGFDIRQWACNVPSVIEHLPAEARSANSELWLTKASTELQEPTLGHSEL